MRRLAPFAISSLFLATAAPAMPSLTAGVPGSPYRVLVTGVDSSEFPRVKLEFKVVIQQVTEQAHRMLHFFVVLQFHPFGEAIEIVLVEIGGHSQIVVGSREFLVQLAVQCGN